MSKFVFKNGKVFSDGYDLSSNVTSVNLEINADELDATTINSNGFKEKLGGLKDSSLQLDGFYEAGANKPDALLGASIGNELIVSVTPEAGVGSTSYFMKSRLFTYSILGAIGEITPFSVSKANSGDVVVRGTTQLDDALTTTGASTGSNLGAVSTGEKVYAAIHCTAVSGTSSPTISFTLQSDDNASFTSPTDVATFTDITAINAQYISDATTTSDTYWRLAYTITGTTPSFDIHASIGIE